MTIQFRPLADIRMIVEDMGTEVSYAYDDLVFPEHTAFLIQFDDEQDKNFKLYFNTEANEEEIPNMKESLDRSALKFGYRCRYSGKFSLNAREETGELELAFFPE